MCFCTLRPNTTQKPVELNYNILLAQTIQHRAEELETVQEVNANGSRMQLLLVMANV